MRLSASLQGQSKVSSPFQDAWKLVDALGSQGVAFLEGERVGEVSDEDAGLEAGFCKDLGEFAEGGADAAVPVKSGQL